MNKIAYIMSRFPHLPETFILREMNELERTGWQISLYPLIIQHQTVLHNTVASWLERVRRTSIFTLDGALANLKYFILHPWNYLRLILRCIWENRTSINFLVRAVFLFPKAVYMAQMMVDEQIDHIHSHYATHPALVAWIIHEITGISYSITVHAHDIFVRTSMLETKMRNAASVVAISKFNREYLARVVGAWIYDKTEVVHCGIEPEKYKNCHIVFDNNDLFEIACVGSLQPYKGHIVLVEACAILEQRKIPFRCRIIGEGKERSGLEKKITAHQLEKRVELLGAKSQEYVADFLPTAHCYVQPSIVASSGKMEGIPVALMEALACGLPVVATSISGIPELVIPGKTGYLVPPSDPLALANMLEMVFHNLGEAAKIGLTGRELVLLEYKLSTNVEELASLFTRIIKNRSKAIT